MVTLMGETYKQQCLHFEIMALISHIAYHTLQPRLSEPVFFFRSAEQ